MSRRGITFICAYYENPGMLREQQRVWRAYPDELKACFHAIVTDDGSPTRPAKPHVEETGIASFILNRTLVDVRWNWLFGRNLGVSQAPTEWVLLTDIDHVLPVETLDVLTAAKFDPRLVYRLSRVDAPNRTPYKPHPNTWFLTKAMFEKIGGYDERFSGFYGSDADFRERVIQATGGKLVMLPDALIRYPREVIPDASTTTYGRKEKQDAENVPRIRAERDRIPDWRPVRLSFPWERQC